LSPLLAQAKLEALDKVVDALAHPARRQILLTVHFRGGAMTAGEIAGRFAHAWPTTTRHLRVLEAAGLLAHEKHGRERIYRLERERLELVKEWLAWFERPSGAVGGADHKAGDKQRCKREGPGESADFGPGELSADRPEKTLTKRERETAALPAAKAKKKTAKKTASPNPAAKKPRKLKSR
jgi:DNA-binding transcriptional ArsR family regulator